MNTNLEHTGVHHVEGRCSGMPRLWCRSVCVPHSAHVQHRLTQKKSNVQVKTENFALRRRLILAPPSQPCVFGKTGLAAGGNSFKVFNACPRGNSHIIAQGLVNLEKCGLN